MNDPSNISPPYADGSGMGGANILMYFKEKPTYDELMQFSNDSVNKYALLYDKYTMLSTQNDDLMSKLANLEATVRDLSAKVGSSNDSDQTVLSSVSDVSKRKRKYKRKRNRHANEYDYDQNASIADDLDPPMEPSDKSISPVNDPNKNKID
jgi:hypothetical protein